jgi:hypothetical protein
MLTQEAVDAGEQEQLSLAVMAASNVGEQVRIVAIEEQVGEPLVGELMGHPPVSSPSKVASLFRPRRVQLLTVPSGTPSWSAICVCERSAK